jgi:hypothetical protein
VKRSAIKRDPEAVRAWQDRSRAPLVRYSALGREGQRSTEERRATAAEYARANGGRSGKIPPAGERHPRRSKGVGRPPTPYWWREEIKGSLCVVCEKRIATEGHHIIRFQVLRREAKRLGYELAAVAFDRRNRLPVCADCHANHHSRSRPIGRDVLLRVARWVFDFARETGLEAALEREYPQGAETGRAGAASPA